MIKEDTTSNTSVFNRDDLHELRNSLSVANLSLLKLEKSIPSLNQTQEIQNLKSALERIQKTIPQRS